MYNGFFWMQNFTTVYVIFQKLPSPQAGLARKRSPSQLHAQTASMQAQLLYMEVLEDA